ncbi:MAG: DUF3179 domain-containing protein [bacterium]|nr:DUF3179 domain-containing protein [bacterium]
MPARIRLMILLVAFGLVAAACSSAKVAEETTSTTSEMPAAAATPSNGPRATTTTTVTLPPNDGKLRNQLGYVFPDAPVLTNTGELAEQVEADLEVLWASLSTTSIDVDAINRVAESEDPRLAWLMVDLLRFIRSGPILAALIAASSSLTGVDFNDDPVASRSPWQSITDHLISWNLPAPPGYREYKGRLFTIIEPAWDPFFQDADATIDWRLTSWGGVRIDNRVLGDQLPCPSGCIPALDDPSVTDAAGGSWYPDERIVFGVVVDGEARAYPKHQMEVHEMVNDTLGGRRIGVPYCTLCGSAQAYFTDSVPAGTEVPVLRTSGLLTRSNKVMYDLNTFSILDTFTGVATTGPLREAGIVLEQTTVIASTWGDWKAAHPDTTILAEDGGIGRSYRLDPLGDRDANGPIFPVGDVDPRLPIQAEVIGVIAADGTSIAFPVDDLRAAMVFLDEVELDGVVIRPDGGGFVASEAGEAVAAHQAFWFAWAQFHPGTLLWAPTSLGS